MKQPDLFFRSFLENEIKRQMEMLNISLIYSEFIMIGNDLL